MAKIVDYYLSLASPWTYMGGRRFEEILKRHGAEAAVKPINLGVVFPRTGGLPLPKRAPERQAYRFVELKRWRDHLGVPLVLEPAHFPPKSDLAPRLVLAADAAGAESLGLAHAILTALWAEERDIDDEATLREIADKAGLDGATLLEQARKDETKARFDELSEEAIGRGVFGSPSYIYRDELFWGQDRLDFLDRALAS